MQVAYLVNQYPKVSHAFIRREIAAVEAAGVRVLRCSLRRSSDRLIDDADKAEAGRTRLVLERGPAALAWATVLTALLSPLRFARALLLATRLGRRSDRGVLLHLVYLAEACLLVRWLRREDIGHLHAHFGTNSATVALLCGRLGRLSYSFTAHGPEEFDRAPLWSLGEKIEHAAFVVAVSHFGRSQLYRLCDRRHWHKIHVVRCGVDGEFLDTPPSPMPGTHKLISIGRLCEQKGQLVLLEALGRLKAEGRKVQLTLVGDGELRGEVERAIAQHDLAGSVELAGWADSQAIRRALDDSCALVLPSFAEGLPVVIMEAFARGRPVLSTYVAGIPELVRPGQNGWLVPAGSVDALAEALRQLLDTPVEKLAELGRDGRARVVEQHDTRRIGVEMASLMRQGRTSPSPAPPAPPLP